MKLAKQNFPHDTSELLETTEFIDILPGTPVNFKRAVSVKLPLPAGFEESAEKKVRYEKKTNYGINYKIIKCIL